MAKHIIKFKEYNRLLTEKYTIKDIKLMMKYFLIKSNKKHKKDLQNELYDYLMRSYYVRKIQNQWRRCIICKMNVTHGPALFKRELCNNPEDFLTTELMKEIDYKFFISYEDNHKFIYGFNIISVSTLFEKTGKINPYTMDPLPAEFVRMVETRQRYNKMFKYLNEPIKPTVPNINNMFVSIFQKLDSLGNYTQIEWITQLNNKSLRRFICELYDIWSYRSGLTNIDKNALCPPFGSPFRGVPMHLFNNRHIFIENGTLHNYIFTICNNLINNTHITRDQQGICSIYILTAITLVNKHAAEALPWLYHSVI